MDKIIFNCLLKSSQKPYNPYLWLNVISATKEKKKVPKQKWSEFLKKQTTYYEEVDDYIIEYRLFFNKVNNENKSDFIYKAYLSDFANKEQSFIRQLINLRSIIIKENEKATTVMAEVTVI